VKTLGLMGSVDNCSKLWITLGMALFRRNFLFKLTYIVILGKFSLRIDRCERKLNPGSSWPLL
ncbi:MAG TPA: hypothetical protein DCY07_08390, partial [Rhodospirillaceae bacterium]|nr:hypothetical protein [Rhodospirillaceae bacterium]